ncbi:MAG: PLP-dependent aspartate aminotransferase family protein [Chitinophagaceae bacterium]|jgi:cystathionine beta-lyase/cystathionine gamma-synthase|nr:PLP-dependent aspartate aminotransferase family protein [Chitinophagaceae bacterium]
MDDLSHILFSLGEERDNYFRSITPPIMQTSNFAFSSVESIRSAFKDEYSTFLYSRGKNPTVDILCKKLAALDGAEDALVVNSGAAAIFLSVTSQVKSGDHIISVRDPYSWARHLFDQILPKWGITCTYVDGRDVANFEIACKPNTKLIYLESPNSWDFAIQDLSAVAKIAKSKGIITICDNSYCTPIYQQPISLGIDLSIQSATKYIGGHSDVVAGVIAGSAALIEPMFRSEYMCVGSGIQPFNAWLLLRGIRTLEARLERSSRSAQKVMEFLKAHPLVEKIFYPLDPSFSQYNLAQAQMKGAGGLFSFRLKLNEIERIEGFVNSLKSFLLAVSWGGYESLVMPKCAGIPKNEFSPLNEQHRMVRLYIGMEDPAYLINDLSSAFSAVQDLS